MQRLVSVVAVAGLAAAAGAQTDGTAVWMAVVNGLGDDGVLNPGEIASVELWVDMMPDVNGDTVLGFGAAIWDTKGDAGAATGKVQGWTFNSNLTFLLGDTTNSDGVNLTNSQAGQVTSFGPFETSDPIWVMTFEWVPNVFQGQTAVYTTSTLGGYISVWTKGDADGTEWAVVNASVKIPVEIPGPATAALLGLGGLVALRRRR
jgi:uncharacterized protein (TIGR03382 family)